MAGEYEKSTSVPLADMSYNVALPRVGVGPTRAYPYPQGTTAEGGAHSMNFDKFGNSTDEPTGGSRIASRGADSTNSPRLVGREDPDSYMRLGAGPVIRP